MKIAIMIGVLALFLLASCAPRAPAPETGNALPGDMETGQPGTEPVTGDDLDDIEQELTDIDEGFGSDTDAALDDLSEGLDLGGQ